MTPPNGQLNRTPAARAAATMRELLEPEGLAAAVDPAGFGGALAEVGKALVRRPLPAARGVLGLAAGTGRAARAALMRGLGAHDAGPASLPEKDRRYADPSWEATRTTFCCASSMRCSARSCGASRPSST